MEERVEQYDTPPPNYAPSSHATNGFSSRLSPAQVASYFVIGLSVCVYWACTTTILPQPWLMAISSITFGILVVSSAIATCTNPTDRVVYYYKWSRHDRTISFVPEYNKVLFCQFCDSYCLANSKHCRSCNRCVDRFDHHCMWFNNCVGQRNYLAFFISIVSTFLYAVFLIAHIILASIEVDYSDSSQLGKAVVSWIVGVLMLIFGFLLLNLIFLHIYLYATDQTTYQFLQRRKKEEQAEREMERQKSQSSSNKVHPSDAPKRNHIEGSQESMANTKLVIVGQHSDQFRGSSKGSSKERPSDFFEEQLQRHTHSKQEEIQSQNLGRMMAQNDPTVHNDDRMSEESDPLPYFLRKNKSLKLLLGGQRTEEPSKRVATEVNTTGRIE